MQISFARSSGAGGQNVNKVTPEQALQQQDVGEDWWFVSWRPSLEDCLAPPWPCPLSSTTLLNRNNLPLPPPLLPQSTTLQVNTKVDMRLRLDAAAWLDEEIREALRQKVSELELAGRLADDRACWLSPAGCIGRRRRRLVLLIVATLAGGAHHLLV